MFKQASVSDLKKAKFPRDTSHLVITMRFYPRFLKKELRDEFVCDLAPVRELLKDFNEAQKRVGHNGAFAECDYERRFALNAKGFAHLKRLAEISRTKDVFLVCICDVGGMCHREILMLLANRLHGAEMDKVYHSYPTALERLLQMSREQCSVVV